MGISEVTFYNWKKKYGGLGVPELRRMRQLEEENFKLKRIIADLSLEKQMLQDVLKKGFEASPIERAGPKPDGRLPGIGPQDLHGYSVAAFGLVLSDQSPG
jgi:putative transposase